MTTAELKGMPVRPSHLVRLGWTQGHSARDRDDEPVDIEDPAACQWCLEGALIACGFDCGNEPGSLYERICSVISHRYGKLPWRWNDQQLRTTQEVAQLLEAIENEREWPRDRVVPDAVLRFVRSHQPPEE